MHNHILKFLLSLLLLPFIITAAAPVPSNPYFSWKTLSQAKSSFAISNVSTTANQCIFSNSNNSVVFNRGSRKATINNVTIWLNVAPEVSMPGRKWHISKIDTDIIALTLRSSSEKNPAPLKIVIDPGHGGDDSGAVSTLKNLCEKDLNLELAKRIGDNLRHQGLKVYYTRDRDKTLALSERSAIARKKKADLFVSIHANKASNTNACGVETFVLTPSGYHGTAQGSPPRGWQIGNINDYNNNLLGYCIQKELTKEPLNVDRGLKRQSFFVLRETHCPAVLIETGFLSNTDDALRMKTEEWKSDCSSKISAGILAYCRKVKSLNQAVAAKRRNEAQANQRWRDHLAQKKVERERAATPVNIVSNQPEVALKDEIAATNKTSKTISDKHSHKDAPSGLMAISDFYRTGKVE